MSDPAQPIIDFQPTKEFFVGIDSDGCAFDTMEVKHKECFIPNTINRWELQAVSKFARQAAEFVNLYSKWRGINRFPALVMTFDLLAEWPDVQKRNVAIPQIPKLRKWVETETRLGNPALQEAVERSGDPDLAQALQWSTEVNDTVEEFVRGVPPFPFMRESVEKIAEKADIFVVSATPCDALQREWEEHDMARHVAVIAGQEMGSKKETLAAACAKGYQPQRMLMIGDAPGDRKAAEANNVLFFPVNPGFEDRSWERFSDEAFDRFIAGDYAGDYAAGLIEEFESYLPETPPWKKD